LQLDCRDACALMRVARQQDALLPSRGMRIVFDLAWQIRTSPEIFLDILRR
jgi:hypothetical protein